MFVDMVNIKQGKPLIWQIFTQPDLSLNDTYDQTTSDELSRLPIVTDCEAIFLEMTAVTPSLGGVGLARGVGGAVLCGVRSESLEPA